MSQLFTQFRFLLIILACNALALSAPAQITVTNNGDSGTGSLRDAINASNASTNGLRITINPGIGTITLLTALPQIDKSCTITGASSVNPLAETGGSIIERSTAQGVPEFSLLWAINSGTNLYLQDLILQGGFGPGDRNNLQGGGGVLFQGGGNITIFRCVLRSNTNTNNRDGGGVQVENGSALITNCLFRVNAAGAGGSEGGGLRTGAQGFTNPLPVTVVNCAFISNTANSGGAIYSRGTTLLLNCSFLLNRSNNNNSGAIYSDGGTITLRNCVLWDNEGANAIRRGSSTITAYNSLIESGENEYTDGGGTQPISSSPFSGTGVELASGSQAINAGDYAAYTAAGGPATDLAGNPRFANGGIDAGAIEFQICNLTPTVFTQPTPQGLAVQVAGGVRYERLKTVDRINGYEIRATEQNTTGYFVITQSGPYSITATDANGCQAQVTGTF